MNTLAMRKSTLSRALFLGATLLLLAGSAWAQCGDGKAPGANGCCSDDECPPGCIQASVTSAQGGGSKCTCLGCAGADVVVNATCASKPMGGWTEKVTPASCMAALGVGDTASFTGSSFTIGSKSCNMCYTKPANSKSFDFDLNKEVTVNTEGKNAVCVSNVAGCFGRGMKIEDGKLSYSSGGGGGGGGDGAAGTTHKVLFMLVASGLAVAAIL